jgi:DNA-binding MarR family transcriptional regulator
MPEQPDADEVAAALRVSIGLLVRRLRQTKAEGELTLPQTTALARIDRDGPTTAAALAKAEQISPQSMGATLAALEQRGLVERGADPADGRRVVLSVSEAGAELLRSRRSARVERLAQALVAEFRPDELAQLAAAAPLLERLGNRI